MPHLPALPESTARRCLPPDILQVIYTESISNPMLIPADIPRLSALAHSRDLKLVVDNTFAPFIIRCEMKCDLPVLHDIKQK